MQASSAFVWLVMEVLAVLLSLYLVTVNTDLTTIDLLAFFGYKYVGYVSVCVSVDVFISPPHPPSFITIDPTNMGLAFPGYE